MEARLPAPELGVTLPWEASFWRRIPVCVLHPAPPALLHRDGREGVTSARPPGESKSVFCWQRLAAVHAAHGASLQGGDNGKEVRTNGRLPMPLPLPARLLTAEEGTAKIADVGMLRRQAAELITAQASLHLGQSI